MSSRFIKLEGESKEVHVKANFVHEVRKVEHGGCLVRYEDSGDLFHCKDTPEKVIELVDDCIDNLMEHERVIMLKAEYKYLREANEAIQQIKALCQSALENDFDAYSLEQEALEKILKIVS